MGQLIQFEEHAVARLRERLGAAEEAKEDLIAFARGHSGAVDSIHVAALLAIEAPSIEVLLDVITSKWPEILGIDAAAITLLVGRHGFRADSSGISRVEPEIVDRMLEKAPLVEVRGVDCGHPLFGAPASGQIRAEALIRIDSEPPLPRGLLVLGQCAELDLDSSHGSALLLFLGRVVGTAVRRAVVTG